MNYQLNESIILPPHSVEAEQSVLGAIMLDSNAFDRIEGLITEADFYRQDHRLIFAAARNLSNAGKPVDAITVSEELEGSGNLSRVGGLASIGEIVQNTPSAANINRYAEIVRERALQRRLLALTIDIQASCMAPGADVAQIIEQADAAMSQLIDTGTDEPTLLYDGMFDAIQDIDDRATGNRPSGMQTGITELDAITGGLEPGQLVIVAASPSVGKTALALNIADLATQQGKSIALFSLEMTRRELIQRLISLRTGVSVSEMRSGKLTHEQWGLISASHGKANGQRLHLIDRSSIGVAYVRATARKLKRKHELDLIIIDYLGLMRGEGQNRTQEIGSLSRGLKALAKELGVPVIVLAQLNRATETRQDKRPMLSDLRDSGEIEQDADIVAMLHREDQHNPAGEWRGLAELIVRKNRNGPLGDLLLSLDGPTMKFSRYTGPDPRKHTPSRMEKHNGKYVHGFND